MPATPRESIPAWQHSDGWFVATIDDAVSRGGPCVLSPLTAGLPPGLADMAYALPVGDANGLVLDALQARDGGAAEIVAAVFAGDPFRRIDDLLDDLAAHGVRGVINWPSVGMLPGEFGAELVHSGFTFALELEMLERARQRGLATIATVSDKDQIRQAAAVHPDMLLVTPGLAADENDAPATRPARLQELLREADEHAPAIERRAYLHPSQPGAGDTPAGSDHAVIRHS
ncbi:phosphoenolpyruvate hydrolase family protein [Aquisalimonas lutea]|uniref:phosphoenolpyruvate hydrolase family protein n=1 Tax=Aquisalimonas lutea TaxID=1327750 RepID=UPI0025B2DF8C|nr:phosphoenolpyruvate hydrolase family protein [Aquisalimonas lutea]MDN3519536.1 phosphoenolpyruvate hydrolase family protein [Aquisalimonas lutea]